MCNYEYVKMWAEFPRWLWPVTNLPKGRKWTDAGVIKTHERGGRDGDFTIWLYPIDNDLYYKTTFGIIVSLSSPFRMAFIKDFKNLQPNVVKLYFDGFNGTSINPNRKFQVLGYMILKLYKDLGIYIGFEEHPANNAEYILGPAHPDHKHDPNDKTLDVGFRVLKVVDSKEEFENMSDTSKITVTLAAEQWDLVVFALRKLSGETRLGILQSVFFTGPHDESVKQMRDFTKEVDETMKAIVKAADVEMVKMGDE